MTLRIQNLDNQNAIVDARGFPTPFFIRFIQDRGGGLTDLEATIIALQEIIDIFSNREIIAGDVLSGGGKLFDGNVTLDHDASLVAPGIYGDATHVPKITVDEFGHIQLVESVPITGGGGGSGFTPPVLSDFPVSLSIGAETQVADTPFGMAMTVGVGGAGSVIRCRLKTYPTPPFSAIFKICASTNVTNTDGMGLVIRDSAGGRLLKIGTEITAGGSPIYQRWTNNTSFNATMIGGGNGTIQDICYKVQDDGTNYRFFLGPTIVGPWMEIYTETKAAWVSSPTQIGFGIEDQNSAYYGLLIQHYEQA